MCAPDEIDVQLPKRQLNEEQAVSGTGKGQTIMYGIIATWRMALEGITEAEHMLKDGATASDAIETAIRAVEDFEYY